MDTTYLFGLSNTGSLSLEDLVPSEAASISIKNSLSLCGLDLSDIDFLISASSTPDFNNPSLAQSILGKLNTAHIGGLEIRQSGAGLLFALDLARSLTSAGIYRNVLVVCAEFLRRAYLSKNETVMDKFLADAEEISSDAVFSCIVCNEKFLNEKKLNISKYIIKDTAVYSNEEGFDCYNTEIPSSSQMPERITLENIKLNMHLPKLNKKLFSEQLKIMTLNSLDSFGVKQCSHFLSHNPADCNKSEYQGSAGIGNALLSLEESGNLKSGETVAAIAAGAGLNWGLCKLEYL